MARHPYIDFDSPWDRDAFEGHGPVSWKRGCYEAQDELECLVHQRASEARLQSFFEVHPYLLPGIDDLGHGPYGGVVATKFMLGNDFQTDFAFATSHSQEVRLTCVEIESARKSIFRRDGAFSRDYLDARQQVADWLLWAHHHVNLALSCWAPLLSRRSSNYLTVTFQGYLVMGSRSELAQPKKQQRWAGEAVSNPPGLRTMTYDRIVARRGLGPPRFDNSRIALCSYRDRRFQAKRVLS